MAGAGYGAHGSMTWLKNRNVARQILAAKAHRRYPGSERPSSQDGRMIFLGIAVAAGAWKVEFSTALRKLATSKLGQRHLANEVHRWERIEESIRLKAVVWAEPVENYFIPSGAGKWEQAQTLPCSIPENFQGGFIIHGYGPDGPQSTFSPTLPPELLDSLPPVQRTASTAGKKTSGKVHYSKMKPDPNVVRCGCGATISAQSRKLALQTLAEHKRMVHGTRLPSRTK